jgi:chromosome segregation ATPase
MSKHYEAKVEKATQETTEARHTITRLEEDVKIKDLEIESLKKEREETAAYLTGLRKRINGILDLRIREKSRLEAEEIGHDQDDLATKLERLNSTVLQMGEVLSKSESEKVAEAQEVAELRHQLEVIAMKRVTEMEEMRELREKLLKSYKETSRQRSLRERTPKKVGKMRFECEEDKQDYFFFRHLSDAISLKKWARAEGEVGVNDLRKAKMRWLRRAEKVLTKKKDGGRVDYIPFKSYLERLLLEYAQVLPEGKVEVKISGDGRSLGRGSSVVLAVSFPQHPKPQSDVSRWCTVNGGTWCGECGINLNC